MQNNIPVALPALFSLANDMEDGIANHGVAVGLLHNTELVFGGDLDAAETADDNFDTAKTSRTTANTALRLADSNARAFIKAASAILAQNLGETWSDAWQSTGFPNNSTAVPTTQDERFALTRKLQVYFADNPTMEVNTPKIVVTSAKALLLRSALGDARTAVNDASTDCGNKIVLRDAAVETLKTRMRSLIAELGTLLDDNDPLWDAFGLNEPGAPSTPDVPEALSVTPGAAGVLHTNWPPARLALHYRVWKQITGVDANPVAVASPADTEATLPGLPSGATAKITVTAVNDAGESLPSAPVTVVVP